MSTKLYVGNLAFTTMEEDLTALFGQAGTVVSCDILLDKFTRKSRGFAFIEMASQEEADAAVEKFNDHELDERKLVVNEARPRESRSPGGFSGGGYGGGGGQGGKRKSGKGSRRGARNAKRDKKAFW